MGTSTSDEARALVAAAGAISDARRTIILARVRALTNTELVSRIVDFENQDFGQELLFCLRERKLEDWEADSLVTAVEKILLRADASTAKQKADLERKATHVALALEPGARAKIAMQCLAHLRKGRRNIGFRLLKNLPLDFDQPGLAYQLYESTNDIRFLKKALDQTVWSGQVDISNLLTAFEGDEYWRARIFESLIKQDVARAVDSAALDPKAFVWAAGRRADPALLPHIDNIFERANDKCALIGIVVWAYGKIGDYGRIIRLEPVLDELGEEVAREAQRLGYSFDLI